MNYGKKRQLCVQVKYTDKELWFGKEQELNGHIIKLLLG